MLNNYVPWSDWRFDEIAAVRYSVEWVCFGFPLEALSIKQKDNAFDCFWQARGFEVKHEWARCWTESGWCRQIYGKYSENKFHQEIRWKMLLNEDAEVCLKSWKKFSQKLKVSKLLNYLPKPVKEHQVEFFSKRFISNV